MPDEKEKKDFSVLKTYAPSTYQNIGVGLDLERNYDPQYGEWVDSTNQSLRLYSPFTLKLILPDIYATYKKEKKDFDFGSLLDTATQATNFLVRNLTDLSSNLAAYIPNLKVNVNAYEESHRKFDNFTQAQEAKKRVQFQNATKFLGGFNSFLQSEKYIVSGEEITADSTKAEITTLTDKNVALDIITQITEISNVPPLTLLINPETLSISYNKIQQYTERGRFGYIFQTWGEEQPKLSVSGRIGAFIAGGSSQIGSGAQAASRNESTSWQNLMNLLIFYKNNGYIYDRIGRSNAMHAIGSISIEYDQWIYEGNMRSFEYELNEENALGGVSFSFEFEVNRMYDVAESSAIVEPYKGMGDLTRQILSGGIRDVGRYDFSSAKGFEEFLFDELVGGENSNNITDLYETELIGYISNKVSEKNQSNNSDTKPSDVPAGSNGWLPS